VAEQAEIERLREAALALAAWTHHHRTCARYTTTAEDCTCGLQEAWAPFDRKAAFDDAMGAEPIITPILVATYGKGSMVHSLAEHLAHRIDTDDYDGRGRKHMVTMECWNWFPGGGTAEGTAAKIEAALKRAFDEDER
jgi:hypothetical protein